MAGPARAPLSGAARATAAAEVPSAASGYAWRLPPGFPRPPVPADNPMSAAKVELGRHLFFDRRLSVTGEYSCASCHRPELAFTDGRATAVGATGESHPRNTMSLANAAYAVRLTWADPDLARLEEQMLTPLLGDSPVELGLGGREEELLGRLRREPRYRRLFAEAFPGATDPFTVDNLTRAVASFERTLVSGSSPYDRYLFFDEPLPAAARRGMRLFFSPRLGCSGCHGGLLLSGPFTWQGGPPAAPVFHNTALYDLDGRGAYPARDPGLSARTGSPADVGRFRAPGLRNVALTAPYMHDGSVAGLEEAIAHYAAGGRAPAGPLKSERLGGFEISSAEIADLVRFLHSLTDPLLLQDPRFSDPWRQSRSGDETPAAPR